MDVTEIEAYDPELLERSALVVLNKLDLVDDAEARAGAELLAEFGLPVVPVSVRSGAGLPELIDLLFQLLPAAPRPLPAVPARRQLVHEPIRVTRDESGRGWIVHGRELEAVVDRFDAGNRDAVAYLQRHFNSLGVHKLLAKAGAATGDEVRIGAASFDYFDEAAAEAEAKASEAAERAEAGAAERRYLDDDELEEAFADGDDGAAWDLDGWTDVASDGAGAAASVGRRSGRKAPADEAPDGPPDPS